LFAQHWTVADFGGGPVLLLQLHGTYCGGDRTTLCVEALVWHEGGFVTP
jgi:hypothetical protein